MDPMNPTVTLNADVGPYVAGLNQAASQTQQLSDAIDRLTKKTAEIRQKAAGGLQVVGAGTLTGLTSLALVAANADRQMSTLAATAKITGSNLDYLKGAVSKMTRDLPVTRGEIVQLTTALSKMGLASDSQTSNFTNLFTRMGAATGENSMGLASQVIQLNRQMGNLNTPAVNQFANSLTKVSAAAGVSATETAQFANSIAPFARAAGIGEQSLIGISAAFTKAGADGYAAANTFNQMMSDITRLTQQGSPALNKYAAAIGVTMDQFKQMDPAEQFVQIVETLQKAGPDAGRILERMGYDGIRASRALQTVAGNAGDLRKAMGLAGQGEGAIQEGSQAAMGGLLDQFTRLRNTSEDLAINFGQSLDGPLAKVVGGFTNFLGIAVEITQVLKPFIGGITALAAAMVTLGTAMKLSSLAGMANLGQSIWKGSLAGARTGFQYGRTGNALAGDPEWLGRANLPVGDPERLNAVQRASVMAGVGWGRLNRDAFGEVDPKRQSMMSRFSGGVAGTAGWLIEAQRQFYADANKPGYDRKSFIVKPIEDALTKRMRAGMENVDAQREGTVGERSGRGTFTGSAFRALAADPRAFFTGLRTAGDIDKAETTKIAESSKTESEYKRRMGAYLKSLEKAAASTITVGRENDRASQEVARYGRLVGQYGRMQATNIGSAAKFGLEGGRMLGGTIGRGVLGLTGGGWGLAAMAGVGAWSMAKKSDAEADQLMQETTNSNLLDRYLQNRGQTSQAISLNDMLKSQTRQLTPNKTMADATTLTDEEYQFATSSGREVQNKRLQGMSQNELVAFLRQNDAQFSAKPELLGDAVLDIATILKDVAATNRVLAEYTGQRTAGAADWQATGEGFDRLQSQSGYWTRNFGVGAAPKLADDLMGRINSIEEGAALNQTAYGGDTGVTYRAMQYQNLLGALPGGLTQDGPLEMARYPGQVSETRTGGKMAPVPWDQGAKEANQQWFQLFRKVEDEYGEGKRLGLDFQDLSRYSNEKYGDQSAAVMNDPNRRTELFSGYLQTKGQTGINISEAMFGKYGAYTPEQLQKLFAEQVANPQKEMDTTSKAMLRGAGKFEGGEGVAKEIITSETVADALINSGNTNKQFAARREIVQSATQGGKSATEAQTLLASMYGEAPETQQYQLGMSAVAELQRQRGVARSMMTRDQRMGDSITNYRGAMQLTGEGSEPLKQAATEELDQMKQDQYAYLQGIALQQREFEVSMARGAEDYQLSRERSQASFHRNMARAEEDYYLQRQYQTEDFNRSLERQQEDFATSIKRQSEDFAKSMYNPYQRTDAQYTWSAEGSLLNLDSQNKDIKNQTSNLKKLDQMGVSQEVIKTLGLADPQNAQQLARYVEELAANPDLVKKFNDALKERVKAAGDLLASGYSETYNRSVADFEKNTSRAISDFDRGIARSARAFSTAQGRAREDFKITMDQMAVDYGRSITRAKEDVIRAQTEIGGNLGTMLDKATKGLAKNLGGAGDELIAKLDEIRTKYPELFGDKPTPKAPTHYPKDFVGPLPPGAKRDLPAGSKPYAYGGRITSPYQVVGEKGPELLSEVSGHIMPANSFQSSVAREVVQALKVSGHSSPVTYKGGGSMHVDQSTQIIGGNWTVQTQDPDEMGRKLKGKERLDRLRSPKPVPA